jgi:hypothetical protein
MPTLGTLSLEDAAKEAAGNWQRFDSFIWFGAQNRRDSNQWAVIYTHHRDSGLLAQSNAAHIRRVMLPFTKGINPDVVMESHSHWAVGHIDGFSIRVFKRKRITEAFRKYHELAEAMDNYPSLDESDYSEREFNTTLKNIKDAAWRVKNEFTLPEGWEEQVYDWLSENRSDEVESKDDEGGYPSEVALREAFGALSFEAK